MRPASLGELLRWARPARERAVLVRARPDVAFTGSRSARLGCLQGLCCPDVQRPQQLLAFTLCFCMWTKRAATRSAEALAGLPALQAHSGCGICVRGCPSFTRTATELVCAQVSGGTRHTRCAGAAGAAHSTSRRASAHRAATPPPRFANVSAPAWAHVPSRLMCHTESRLWRLRNADSPSY